ncbi:RNA-directed DNA polymerase, eukaryota [Tanacetum coccineum]
MFLVLSRMAMDILSVQATSVASESAFSTSGRVLSIRRTRLTPAVSLPSLACPLCDHVLEDSSHLFFGCSVAKDIQKLICRWWNLDVHPYESYEDWLSWFKSIRLGSKTKEMLEGVFYVSW